MEETSVFKDSILAQGKEVGELARQLYPNGVLIDEDYTNPLGAIQHTQTAIHDKAQAIFEGAFLFDNILVRIDILAKNDDETFDLIEVKSGTSLKDEYLPDCAIQAYVLKNLGISLRKICVAYLNSEYVRKGPLDFANLFVIKPVNDKISDEWQVIPGYLSSIKSTLSCDKEPTMAIGSICKNPYICEFKNYCWGDVTEKSIHYLYRITDNKRQILLGMGVELSKDIPENFVLSDQQKIQVESDKKLSRYIDKESVVTHLKELCYPLYFLDFETTGYAIPQFDDTFPYQKLVFQFSLHVKKNQDADLEHFDFLFEQDTNPMRKIAENLVQDIGEEGSIVVYHESFERGCIEDMAQQFPDLAHKLNNMVERLWDLEKPFAKKWFYDPKFNGSSSIKMVSPALAPDVNYKDLVIQKGDIAQSTYARYLTLPISDPAREKTKNDLLKYCELDTFAMVRVLEELEKLI